MGQNKETDQVRVKKKTETKFKDLKKWCHKQDFGVSVFDVLLLTINFRLRDQTVEGRVTDLTKSGRVDLASGMFCLLAQKLKKDEQREKDNTEDAHALELFEKIDQASMHFRENSSLLLVIGKEPLQDIARFILYHAKKKKDIYSK